jgi:dihydropteroate synthase
VSEDDEVARVVPIIRAIKEITIVWSALTPIKRARPVRPKAGADILNDVWAGLYDGDMLALV